MDKIAKKRQPDYDQHKQSHNIRVTDKGWKGFDLLAQSFGISRSELIERLGRGMLSPGEFQSEYKKFIDKG